VIVQESEADQLRERLVTYIEKIRVGNGLDPQTTMGPLVSRQQLETVMDYVQKGLKDQSTLVVGGRQLSENPDREGYFYAPTLFDHVSAKSALAQEEIFGPVLPLIRVKNADEAFEVANSTRYGLAASLFTGNRRLVDEFVQGVESGMVHVNHGTASQAHVPFGGVKDSGQGAFSIGPTVKEAFSNVKTVYIKW
jgi:aldehyde dehydrogenase (NAD+)